MAYTGTDLNKAEKGYVDEQDQALQDQIDLADFVTELDANDFDAGSYFKVEDDGSGTNNVFVPKTIAEMKADLGLPTKTYKALINTTGTNAPVVAILFNNFSGSLTWARSDVGVLTLTSADNELTADKTLIYLTMRRTSLATIVVAEDAHESIFKLYNNAGTLADGLDFFVSIEVYD